MYSRCRIELAACALALLLGACDHRTPGAPANAASNVAGVITSQLAPGLDHGLVTVDPRAAAYYDNPEAVMTGKRLFGQYNCAGCHSNGGGGMAPALMDDQWIYGGRLEQIHQTLVEGRPNGMPAWGGKVTDAELWQISAYVRSMSLPQTLAAQQGLTPSQLPAPVPAQVDQDTGWSPDPATTNDYTSLTPGPH